MKNLIVVWSALVLAAFVASVSAADQQGPKVDLNKAGIAELDTLPGVGPAIAQRIIDFRTKNGAFKRAEDLMNVSGIGEKKFLKMKDRVVVSTAPSKAAAATGKPTAALTPAKRN
jgi:comEA protein